MLTERPVQNAPQRLGTIRPRCRDVPAAGDSVFLGILPVPPIEKPGRFQRRPIDTVEASRINRNLVGLRTRYIKRMHAAMPTKRMLRDAGLERVNRQGVLAEQQLKFRRKGRQMQYPLLRAHRTTALRQKVEIDLGSEPYCSAMTATFPGFKHGSVSPSGGTQYCLNWLPDHPFRHGRDKPRSIYTSRCANGRSAMAQPLWATRRGTVESQVARTSRSITIKQPRSAINLICCYTTARTSYPKSKCFSISFFTSVIWVKY